jgi:1,4-dihydroxy-2-naphthoate octaprenyltransferase
VRVTSTTERPESRARSYARLAKLDVFDYYLSIPLVLSAVLLPLTRFDLVVLPMLLAFLLGEVLAMAALVALDDLTGYRDGSDITNYGPDTPLRRKLRKPLVAGTLTPREVIRFAWLTWILGGGLLALAVAIGPHRPLWTVVLVVVTYLSMPHYSYGAKISYHGFQEFYIAALGWALVLAPYGLASGQFSWFMLIQALLFGLGPLLFGVYSNTNDIDGDRGVGRPTVAALASPRGNALFIGVLSAAEFLIGAVGSLTGAAPWWFVLLMLPVTVLRARQYWTGFRAHDIMRARKAGFTVHRLSVLLLIGANILAGAW